MSHVTEIPGRPTVVLVHGAFADGSSWNGVVERLQAKGISVTAPASQRAGPPLAEASDGLVPKQNVAGSNPVSRSNSPS